jgi:hypothetical protein
MNVSLTAIYHDLKPYETARYRVENENGGLVGYVSAMFSDGRRYFVAWTDYGIRQEVRRRKDAIHILTTLT